jgi:hypothetical protein
MTDPAHRLIRFVRAEVKQLDQDACDATVELHLRRPVGRVRRPRGPGTGGGGQLVESLNQRIVPVTLAASRGSDQRTLLGVCDVGDDPCREAALAVLSATNRFLDILTD